MARQLRHQDHLRLATMWDIFCAGLEGRYEEAEALTEQLTGVVWKDRPPAEPADRLGLHPRPEMAAR